jgi:hypothetical protein
LGIGDWAQSPIPNPQSPIPNPHYKNYKSEIKLIILKLKENKILIKIYIFVKNVTYKLCYLL